MDGFRSVRNEMFIEPVAIKIEKAHLWATEYSAPLELQIPSMLVFYKHHAATRLV